MAGTDPLDLFGAVLSPEQLPIKRAQELEARGFNPRGGAATGSMLRRLIQGRGKDEERIRVQKNQEILQEAGKTVNSKIRAGIDPELAQILVMHEAASKLEAAGSVKEGSQLRVRAMAAMSARTEQQAQIGKLLAERDRAKAAADKDRRPEQPQDEFRRLQIAREAINRQILEDPENKGLIRQAAELTARIDKLKDKPEVVGRTEGDIALLQGGGLDKKTRQDVLTGLDAAQRSRRGLLGIMDTFDKSFLTLGGKLQAGIASYKAGLGVSLSPDEASNLAGRAVFMQTALEGLNTYIHDMTGAQMSEFEAKRLRKVPPDPENDDWVQFGTKTIRQLFELEAAERRFTWMINNNRFDLIDLIAADNFAPAAFSEFDLRNDKWLDSKARDKAIELFVKGEVSIGQAVAQATAQTRAGGQPPASAAQGTGNTATGNTRIQIRKKTVP